MLLIEHMQHFCMDSDMDLFLTKKITMKLPPIFEHFSVSLANNSNSIPGCFLDV